MYLSRFEINIARRQARLLLASPHRVHAATMAAFPPARPEAPGRILWRIDEHDRGAVLYVVSPDRPDFTHLVESVGWPTTQSWETRDYEPLLDSLRSGDEWAFRLTANPVRARRRRDERDTRSDGAVDAHDGKKPRSRRIGHVTIAQQADWLLARAERFGFVVPNTVDKQPDVAVHGRRVRRFEREGKQVTLSTATFQGRLSIVNLDRLRMALTEGIGPAKGYGCGLLTLAPLRRHG